MKSTKIMLAIILFTFKSNACNKDTLIVKTDFLLGINLSGGNKAMYGGNLKVNFSVNNSAIETNIAPSFTINYITDNSNNLIIQRRELYNSLTVSHKISDKWKLLAFSEFDNSLLQKIDVRLNIGTGTSYKLKIDNFEINISEVLLVEKLNSKSQNINDYFVVRASTRLKTILKTKFFNFSTIHLFQPAVYTDRNISLNNHLIYRTNNKIDFNLTKKVALGFNYDTILQRYTAFSTKSVKPFDWNSSFFILYKL